MTPLARAWAMLAALLTVSCGVPLMKLPPGPGRAAPDAEDAVTEATLACRAVSTLTAVVAVSGSVRGHRMRGHLLAGLAPPASARLEAVAPFGPPLFIFVARGNDATLLLPRDERVLEHGRPDDVLEAMTGVPLDASDLRTTLTGCAPAPDWQGARHVGDDWRVVPDGPNEVYLRRNPHAAPWRLVAAVHRGAAGAEWRAEYRDFENGLPRTIRLASAESGRFDLRLALSQVDINVPLEADVFRLQVPKSAQPITIDELQQSGPFAAPGGRGQPKRGDGPPPARSAKGGQGSPD